MNLTKKINVKTYWILAKYKVKKENTPMLSILTAVDEAMEDVGYINAAILCEELLFPLTEQAGENLLLRLKDMKYLKKYIHPNEDWEEYDYREDYNDKDDSDDNDYILTRLGQKAVQNKAYYEERKGVLKIYVASNQNDFITQDILKIEELAKDIKDDEAAKVKDVPSFIRKMANEEEVLVLNNGAYVLDEIERKGIIGNSQNEVLKVSITEKGSIAKILDYEHQKNDWSLGLIRKEILLNAYNGNFVLNQNIVKVPFDANRVLLSRKETITAPKIKSTTFEPLQLNINVSPRNNAEAESWYLELLRQKVVSRTHFLSELEFINYGNDLAKNFILFKRELTNRFSRNRVLKAFDEDKDFYIRAKLETIDYLNY